MSEPQGATDSSETGAIDRPARVAPLFPASPVVPKPFVGREAALTRSLMHLDRDSVVGLSGPAGSGKSALAAAIARERKQPTTWVTLSEVAHDQIDELLWQLARPLTQRDPALKDELEQLRRESYPSLVRLQSILTAYAHQPEDALICIDHVEQAMSPSLRLLLIELCEYVALNEHTGIDLVIIGRALPIRLRPYMIPPLNGLSSEAISGWAAAARLSFTAEQIAQIATQTGGLPTALQSLRLALDELSPADLPHSELMALRDLRQLVVSILGELPVEAQRTAADLAAHPERYMSLSAEALSILELLEAQHLVTITPADVRLHPFLQSYYQQLLG